MLEDFKSKQSIPYKILLEQIKNQKLFHAYLIERNGSNDAFDLALAFSKAILCPKHYINNQKCFECKQCENINNNNFIEIKIIDAIGTWIKKEQLIDLQEEFRTKSIIGKKRIYIIKEAEKLNKNSANSLLKFIEEPAPDVIAILICENRYQLLETIVSRCQIISLHNSLNMNNTIVEKIANYLYTNNSEAKKFIDDETSIKKINKVLEFIQYYEKNKLDTLLFINNLWTSFFKTRNDVLIAFEIMILYYRDILFYKCNKNLEIFNLDNKIKEINQKNSKNDLCFKIGKILELKKYLKYNANTNLLLNRLIIDLERKNYV